MEQVRAARPEDAGAIAAVYVETWHDTYADIIPVHVLLGLTRERQETFWRRHILHAPAGDATLVAETEGAGIVGFGNGGPLRGSTLPFEAEVFTLYVLPEFHGLGLGRRLLRSLFARLQESGHGSALVWVLAHNPARFFYETMGGVLVATREEMFRDVCLKELGYGWPDLASVPAAGDLARRD